MNFIHLKAEITDLSKVRGENTISSGIYKITNLKNEKIYIGSSSNIERRFIEHKSDLINNRHHSYKMQNDFNINSNINDFSFEIIEEINGSKQELFRKEQFYIDKYDAFNIGYNCCEYSVNPKYMGKRLTNACSKPTNLPNYVKIPREIIYNKDIGDKRVILFSYLCSRRALDDTVAFSISELCYWSHLKPNYHDGKINHKYLEVLELFSHHGYFENHPDFQKLAKEKKNSTDYYNVKVDIKKFDVPDNFGIIYFDELEKILNFKRELKGLKIDDKEIDLNRMSSAYILLLLSYLRVNMNRNLDKPLCCYRLYQKIAEDIGLSERYITRIVEMLDVMDIVKYKEGKRIRYKKKENEYGFLTTPKVFADYKHYVKDKNGNQIIDINYDFKYEIQKQLKILDATTKKYI